MRCGAKGCSEAAGFYYEGLPGFENVAWLLCTRHLFAFAGKYGPDVVLDAKELRELRNGPADDPGSPA